METGASAAYPPRMRATIARITRINRRIIPIAPLLLVIGCGEATLPGDSTVNDCSECDPQASCTPSVGAFVCTCLDGFTGSGTSCQDVDECAQQAACGAGVECVNLPGSYECLCPPGQVDNGNGCELQWELVAELGGITLDYGYGFNAVGQDTRIYFAPEVSDVPAYFMSYDVFTGEVLNHAPMPDATNDFCACGYGGWLVSYQGLIYQFANYGQYYVGDTWIQASYPQEYMRGEAATAVAADRLFMVGGRGYLSTVQSFAGNGTQGVWSVPGEVAPYLWGVERAVAAGEGNLLYVFGGTTDTGDDKTAAVYDTFNNAWSILPPLPEGMPSPRGAVVLYGMAFVMNYSIIHVYDPFIGDWSDMIEVPFQGSFMPVTVDGDLYIIGQQGANVAIYRLVNF